MPALRTSTRGSISVLLFLLLAGAIALRAETGGARQGGGLDLALCAPGTNTFSVDTIDNRYFPLPARTRWVLTGSEGGLNIALQITVTDATERLYGPGAGGIRTRVVEELEWADTNGNGAVDQGEIPIEISQNYFAQAANGTVCYFGETVDIYDDTGAVVGHDGSWRADQPGHAPGIFMPAAPAPGTKFVQEVAPGIAEDEASIVGASTETVPAGTFTDTLRVRETNPLGGGKGYKSYAAGVGLIVDGPVRLVSSTLLATAAAPPEPSEPQAATAPEPEPLPHAAEATTDDPRGIGRKTRKSAKRDHPTATSDEAEETAHG